MEKEPKRVPSQEDMDRFEEDHKKFEEASKNLTDEEKNVINYIHFHFSGEDGHKLPKQDELEKSAKEKLSQAGIDTNNLGRYLEVQK